VVSLLLIHFRLFDICCYGEPKNRTVSYIILSNKNLYFNSHSGAPPHPLMPETAACKQSTRDKAFKREI
jgi:hypothetical protein